MLTRSLVKYSLSFLFLSASLLGPLLFSSNAKAEPIQVVATTSMVSDLVKNVGGADVVVTSLMGPGVDPHLYRATQGDLERLSAAEMIFYNGLNLEGKMGEIFERMAERKPTVAIGSKLDQTKLLHPEHFEGLPDPHIWFDVTLWSETLAPIVNALSQFRPDSRQQFESNANSYLEQLKALDSWVRQEIASIPKARRVLITAHDAFGYFGRAYDLEVIGLQGISTSAEYGLQDVKRIVDQILERKIRSIFVETSVPERFIRSVQEGVRARGGNVEIGGALFSDAMGDSGTPEGTYLGMVRRNVTTIKKGLE